MLPDDWVKSFCWKHCLFVDSMEFESHLFPTTGSSRFAGNSTLLVRSPRRTNPLFPTTRLNRFVGNVSSIALISVLVILPDDWAKSFCWKPEAVHDVPCDEV